jgi:hypothetical protein
MIRTESCEQRSGSVDSGQDLSVQCNTKSGLAVFLLIHYFVRYLANGLTASD